MEGSPGAHDLGTFPEREDQSGPMSLYLPWHSWPLHSSHRVVVFSRGICLSTSTAAKQRRPFELSITYMADPAILKPSSAPLTVS